MAELASALEAYIMDERLPASCKLFEGLVEVPDSALPKELERLLNVRSQYCALRESIDLRHQVFYEPGETTPARHPYHHPDNLERMPWLMNRSKGGGLPEVPRLLNCAIQARNAGRPEVVQAVQDAMYALVPLNAAMHTARGADLYTKIEVIAALRIVDRAFTAEGTSDAEISTDHLNIRRQTRFEPPSIELALAAYAKQGRRNARAASFMSIGTEEIRGTDEELLRPYCSVEAMNGMRRFVSELEVLTGHTFRKNDQGFPVGPFSVKTEAKEILRWCYRCLARFLLECDEEHDDDPNASPYGVLILILVNELIFGFRCPGTGLRLDFSGTPHSPLRPTVVAHAQHGRPGCFGLRTKLPTTIRD